jgi:hypothetical protein
MSERIERRVKRIVCSDLEVVLVLDDDSVLVGLIDAGLDMAGFGFPACWKARGTFASPSFKVERIP